MKMFSMILIATILTTSPCALAETGYTTNEWTAWPRPYTTNSVAQMYPDVAVGNNGSFLCAWIDRYYSGVAAGRVYATRVAMDGVVLDTNGICVSASMGPYYGSSWYQASAAAVAVQNDFWVLYPYEGLVSRVFCRPVSVNASTGSEFQVGTGVGYASIERIRAASIPSQAVIVVWSYQMGDWQYSVVDPITTNLIVDSAVLTTDAPVADYPDMAVASSSDGFLFVRWDNAANKLYGTKISATGNIVWTNTIASIPYRDTWANPGVDAMPYSNGWLVAYNEPRRGGLVAGSFVDQDGIVSTNVFSISIPCPTGETFKTYIDMQQASGGYRVAWSGYAPFASTKYWAAVLSLDPTFGIVTSEVVKEVVNTGPGGSQMAFSLNPSGTCLAIWPSGSAQHLVGGMYVDQCRVFRLDLENHAGQVLAQMRGGTSNVVESSQDLASEDFQPISNSWLTADRPSWGLFTNLPAISNREFYRVRNYAVE